MRRDWTAANAKRGPCRYCGRTGSRIELAHIAGRRYDRPARPGAKTLRVDPDSVIPLCGPFTDSRSCHARFDHHEIDLIGGVTPAEFLRCVEDLGSEEAALIRLVPSRYDRQTKVRT